MTLRTSSTTQVATIHLSSSVCVQLLWFIESAQSENNVNISWSSPYTEALDGTVSCEVEPYIPLSPPYPNSQGDSLHSHTLSGDI